MAKPLKKKLEKHARLSAKSVEESLGKLRSGDVSSKTAMAGAVVAGVAGVVAAIHLLRRDKDERAILHVVAKQDQWEINADGADRPVGVFGTKKAAVDAARHAATEAAPSELVIHRKDGSVMRRHSYRPA